MPCKRIRPIINMEVRHLCRRPYPGHKKGCPNYGKRDTCPPNAPLLSHFFDVMKPIYAVWVTFDLGAHVKRMRAKQPEWSYRQLSCCLYWQGTARKALKQEINELGIQFGNPNFEVVGSLIPEAMGVDVTATMRRIGIVLEWPPLKTVYKIAFVGSPAKARHRQARAPKQQILFAT